MSPAPPRISESEWTVMKELWRAHPRTSGQLIETLAAPNGWAAPTVKSLIARLVAKGAVGFEKQGREYLYRPLVAEAECAKAESASFLRRVFNGSLTPMVAAFLEREELSQDEIAELKALLKAKEGKGHDRAR